MDDDPGRAVAHRDADAVALLDAGAGQRLGELLGVAMKIGEFQPLLARDQRLDLAVEGAEDVEEERQRARQVGDIGAAQLVMADVEAALLAQHMGQHRVILPVECARHAFSSLAFAFSYAPFMKARTLRGKP